MWRRAALLALTLALRVAVAAAPPPWPEDDSGVPEAVAWSHPIGDPPVSRGSPRCRGRCVDDGEAAGAPLGGMGAGTLGRTYRGDFARWHLRPGTHTHAPAAHTFAAVRVDGLATVLSSLDAHGGWDLDDDDDDGDDARRANRTSTETTARRRVLPADGSGGTYRALYPRSSYSYVPGSISARGDVALTQTQFSPVLPGRYREASLPVAVFRFTARNTETRTVNVSLMFQFENPTRTRDVAPWRQRGKRGNERTRPSGDAAAHAAFGVGSDARAGGPADGATTKTSSNASTSTESPNGASRFSVSHRGAHMYTKRVVDGDANTPVSEPWHGGLAVAAAEAAGARVTVTPGVFSRAAAASHWRAFEARGECVSSSGARSDALDVPANASLAYSAVCVSFALAPGALRDVAFSVAWDFPVASFAETDADSRAKHADRFATAFIKRYARYHPHGGELVPLGAAAPALAALALARAADWEAAVRAWQQPYVDSALWRPRKKRNEGGETDETATRVRRPAWLVSALFNELHHLVDAGTLWGRPLGVDGVRGLPASFFVRSNAGEPFERRDGGEDGEGGDAADVAGNGGVWGGSLGRFGLASNRDAPTYNAAPAYFLGSWALARFWPGLDLSVVADLASAVRFEDDAERETRWAADASATRRAALPRTSAPAANASRFVAVARKRRKVRGAAPHDLGDAREGFALGRGPLRDAVNAHDVSDVNAWLDLAPTLALLVTRAHVLRLPPDGDTTPGGLPDGVLRSLFAGAYESVSTLARTRDADGDGALEHVADPATHGPDHAFDRWAVAAGSKSAYCGSLWLAALRACAAIAAALGETRAAVSLDAAGARAARALNDALWVPSPARGAAERFGKNPETGYYRHDESGGALGNASSVAQVLGEWALATLGLAPAHPPARTREALATVLRANARGGATFPANAADASSGVASHADLHSGERWPGFAYVVAAHAVLVTDAGGDASSFEGGEPGTNENADDADDEKADRALARAAWASARAAHDAAWTRGLAFRAPEAMDDEGRFRGASDIKNGAVWVLDRALTQWASREREGGSFANDRPGFFESDARDEL